LVIVLAALAVASASAAPTDGAGGSGGAVIDRVAHVASPGPDDAAAEPAYAHRAAASLQSFLSPKTQRWSGWWTSANAMTALIDYMDLSGSREYLYTIDQVYNANKGEKFINTFYDDMAWWGLAWLRAYDLTEDPKYLDSSRYIADHMYTKGWDAKCGGGVYWKKQEGKFAVENELFIKLTAGIHNRTSGDTRYLGMAKKAWEWFAASGMINSAGMVNDGLDSRTCKNNGGVTWSYNQGIILGALVELYEATSDESYLTSATSLAEASMADLSKGNGGILTEKTAPACGKCTSGNEMAFKGVYARNLRELGAVTRSGEIGDFLRRNAASAWAKGRGPSDIIGFRWQGPYDRADSVNQQSALDLFNSTLTEKLPTNLAEGRTATSSGQCSADQRPELAFDGSAGTKWCARPTTGGADLVVDLGREQPVNRVRILHAGAGGEKTIWNTRAFEIYTADSADGPWRQVVKVNANTSSSTFHTLEGTDTRFVRLHVTDPGADRTVRIYELAVE
jgi:predicted alpha-1,6-mannanase (GH76 family)